jgi:hypothetical protein
MRAHDPRPERAKLAVLALIALASVAFGVPACGGDDNPRPPTSSSTGDTTSSTTSSTSAGTGGSGGGTTSTSTSGGTGGGDAGPNCDGPNGCYSCAPQTTTQYLNACTNAQCSPFDNVARLPLYNNGNLPPIP